MRQKRYFKRKNTHRTIHHLCFVSLFGKYTCFSGILLCPHAVRMPEILLSRKKDNDFFVEGRNAECFVRDSKKSYF